MDLKVIELWRGLLKIKDYCNNIDDCSKCDFFTLSGCLFKSGKSPNVWHTPNAIIMKAKCPEIIIKEFDENVANDKEGD